MSDYVQSVIDSFPPLTREQIDLIATILARHTDTPAS